MTAPISKLAQRRSASDGFIIVAVLWILGALSALVSIYAVYVINSAAGFGELDNHLRAEALIGAAVELTAYHQLTVPALSRPSRGEFSFRLGKASITVSFCSETARIDLNTAPKQLLVGLFKVLGAHAADAEHYGDRIIAWRTKPNDTASESSDATAASQRARGGKFPHVNELALVDDLPISLVERALPFITVYSGRPQVNVADAPPEVIAALPGMNTDRINSFLAQRLADPASPAQKEALLQSLGPAQQFATTEGSRAVRVKAKIAFDNGHQTQSEVVILLFDEGNEPFSILSWHDVGVAQSDMESRTRIR
jgi:general secretion pathway protein K